MFIEESLGKHRQQARVACVRIDVKSFYMRVCEKASFVGDFKIKTYLV